jgi:hypothetical protein
LEKKGYFQLTAAETCDERVEKATEKVLEGAEKAVEAMEGDIGE